MAKVKCPSSVRSVASVRRGLFGRTYARSGLRARKNVSFPRLYFVRVLFSSRSGA